MDEHRTMQPFSTTTEALATWSSPFGIWKPTWLDRDKQATGNENDGVFCLCVNERWYDVCIVREQLCTPRVELLLESLRPLYLPRTYR